MMFLKFFSQKSIGFSVLGQTIKYALITTKQNKVFVEESLIFNINCKTALHRLQDLLNLYPSSLSIDSEKVFLTSGPEDIKSIKDRKLIVKNKIESLISSDEVQLRSQSNCSSRKTSYYCIRNNQEKRLQEQLKRLKLNPQKIITPPQALLSFKTFSSKAEKSIHLHLFNEKVDTLSLSKRTLLSSQSFSTKDLTPAQVTKKVLCQIFLLTSDKKTTELFIQGPQEKHTPILNALENIPYIKLKSAPYGDFEKSHPEFLVEIGAAVGLFKLFKQSFQKATLSKTWKVYKRTLLLQLPIILATLTLSFFSWNVKTRRVQAQNKAILIRSFTKLGSTLPKEPDFNGADLLSKSLKSKQKKSPLLRLRAPNFSVSETLTWLTDLFNRVNLEHPSPFIVENFKYSIGKTGKKQTLPAQINLSFSASNSLVARKIYDEICKSKQFVDLSKTISWNYQNNQYHVGFFLKNKPQEKL